MASYQGQYLYMALTLVAALIFIAWAGHRYVGQTTEKQIARIASRTTAQEHAARLQQQLQDLEQGLGQQIIEPGSVPEPELKKMLAQLDARFRVLAQDLDEQDTDQDVLQGFISSTDLSAFRYEAMSFLHISRNNMLRFPSSYIMRAYMQPRSRAIKDTLDNLIYQTPEATQENSFSHLAYQARHTWQQLLSEFRLLVANRFSVFSDTPQDGMASRTYNVQLYLEQMRAILKKLEHTSPPENSLPLPEGNWQHLYQNIDQWEKHYGDLVSSLNSDNWRQDLYMFKASLQPKIKTMKASLASLQNRLGAQASRDITELTDSTSRLSQAILVMAIVGALLIISAYYYLKFRVIKPMSDTAHALRQEASGDSQVVIPIPKLKETRDLVEAFGEMRRQVIKREQRLDHLAHHDPLTRLPNRLLFKDRLEHALQIAARHNTMISCLFLDLDNFKQINDTLGHLAGDELLIAVAHRLKKVIRGSDTIARLGGDEFAILLEDIHEKAFARNISRKILEALQEPYIINNQEFHITASVGIATAPFDDNQSDDLLRDADAAMYEAKRRGKNNFQFFTGDLLHKANQQLDLEQRLRKAVQNNEFLYHYQPIISTSNGQLIAVEALMRWQPEDGDIVYPDTFIEPLKNLSLELRRKLGDHLFQQVNQVQSAALQQHGIPLRVAMNLSCTVLRDPTRHRDMINSIARLEFPSLINLEITEDTLMEDLANARALLGELRQLGIPLALDDFGTGQSSLNHLRSFPFDSIKIDREFVRNISTEPEDAILVQAIVQLAHSFNMKVVAEGVETETQKRYLMDIDCDYLQGFLISKPLPEQQLLELLATYSNSGN
ncbi:putative bifunctional diguanylate cyclase/phosphodiesterase [Thiolapillus brandeum]|nr:EAL domain-containing protein [Thiolapillus brandeum]